MKVCLLITAFWVALNVAVCAAIGWTVGWPDRSPPIDVTHPDGRITRTDRKAIDMPDEAGTRVLIDDFAFRLLLDNHLLSRAEWQQMLVVGGSSAAIAFRCGWLQDRVPGYQVNNLALFGTNLTAVRQICEACLSELPADVRPGSDLVLGISEALFRSDESLCGKNGMTRQRGGGVAQWMTVVDRAMQRCPLVLDPGHPIGRLLPSAVADALRERCRVWQRLILGRRSYPAEWLATRSPWRLQTPATRQERLRRESARPPRSKTWREMNVVELADGLRRSTPSTGPTLDPEQCEHLVALVRKASVAGLRVVVIDMPLHRPNREAVNLEPYRRRPWELLRPFVHAGTASLVDLSSAVDDEGFADLVHPSLDGLRRWSDILGDALAGEVGARPPGIRD